MHVNARRVIVRFNIRRALSTLVITLVDSARDTRKNSRKDAKRIFESFSRVDHPVRLETIEARRGNWGGIYKKKKNNENEGEQEWNRVERVCGNDPRRENRRKKLEERRGAARYVDETAGSLLHPAGSYFLSSCERY